jgi:hypothetical protein
MLCFFPLPSRRGQRTHARPAFHRPWLEGLETRVVPSISNGTILVTNTLNIDPNAVTGILGVDPITGAQSFVSSGGYFSEPLDIREAPSHQLYVADYLAASPSGATGAIIGVDPNTGAQKVVATGGSINGPDALEYLDGHIYVSDVGDFSGSFNNIVEVTPSNGRQRVVTSGGSLQTPVALAPAPGNNIYVGDYSAFGTGAVFEVNLHTGAQTLISSGGYFNVIPDLAIDPQGRVDVDVAGDPTTREGSVVRVDPATGAQTLVSTGGLLRDLNGITVGPDGTIFVTTYQSLSAAGTLSAVVAVDPVTGAQRLVSSENNMDFTAGLVVFRTNQGNGGMDPDTTAQQPLVALAASLTWHAPSMASSSTVNESGLGFLSTVGHERMEVQVFGRHEGIASSQPLAATTGLAVHHRAVDEMFANLNTDLVS